MSAKRLGEPIKFTVRATRRRTSAVAAGAGGDGKDAAGSVAESGSGSSGSSGGGGGGAGASAGAGAGAAGGRGRQTSNDASTVFQSVGDNGSDDDDDCGSASHLDDEPLRTTRVVYGQMMTLEDAASKAARLTREGTAFAEGGSFRQATGKWNEALECTPGDWKLYELKAQAALELGEFFPAIQAATKATELAPAWPPGWLTLGRGQLNLGELDLAVTTLCKVVSEMKDSPEAVDAAEDLAYARELCVRRDAFVAAAPLDEGALYSRAAGIAGNAAPPTSTHAARLANS